MFQSAPFMMWVFGYGSLTWKVDFPYESKLTGYITGFQRRFYQHSIDHRGVPEQPGRVVTLIPGEPDDKVHGVAYLVSSENTLEVTKHLDFREKNGYKKHTITFHPLEPETLPFPLTIYIATSDNESYAGFADIPEIASQIFRSQGPSGHNKEYLYNLAEAMRVIAPTHPDSHLFDLEKAVRALESSV